MIYSPFIAFDLFAAAGAGIFEAAVLALIDFAAGRNKPWAYYVGAALGDTAAATGIPGANAVLYVAGSAVDVLLFHSPDGSDVQYFLDGVLLGEIDLFASSATWLGLHVVLPNLSQHTLTIVNHALSPSNTSGIQWLGIGPVTITDGIISPRRTPVTNPAIVSIGIQDANGDPKPLPLFIPSGSLLLADYAAFVASFAPLLDAVIDGLITDAVLTVPLALPGGLKSAAVANSDVETGALLDFLAAGTTYVYGTYVPTWKVANFTGKVVNPAGTGVAAFFDAYRVGLGSAPKVQPSDKYNDLIASFKKGSKRFRRG